MAELTVSDVNNGPVIIGVSTMMMALATTTVLLRIWIRLYRRIKLGLDDWLLLIAFLFLTGFFVLIIVQVNYGGLGKPLLVNLMQDLDILNRYMRMLIAQEIMCPVVLTFIKLSILSMYLRAFPVPSMRISCAVISVLVIIWGVAASVSAIVQCNPIEKAWTPFMTEGTCNHLMQSWLGWGSTIPEIATDVAIVILPIYKIIQLHNTLSTKVALCSIFALSGLVIISSIIRFVYGYRIFLEFESTDLTLNMGTVALWTWIELCTATICACLPVLRPAWAMILNKMRLGSSPTPKITPLVDVPTTIGGSGGGYDRRARLLRDGSKKSHDSVITDDSHIDESLALPEARSMA